MSITVIQASRGLAVWSKGIPSRLFMPAPNSPISGRVKMIQIVPMVFHGIRQGQGDGHQAKAGTPHPFLGMARAMRIPRGISMSSTNPEKRNWRQSAS